MLDREQEAVLVNGTAVSFVKSPGEERGGIDLSGRPGDDGGGRAVDDREDGHPGGREQHAEDVHRALDDLLLLRDLRQRAEKVEGCGEVRRPAVSQAQRGERLGPLDLESPPGDQTREVQANVVQAHRDDLRWKADEGRELPQRVDAPGNGSGVEQHHAPHGLSEDRGRGRRVDAQMLDAGAPVGEPTGRDEIRSGGEIVVDERGGRDQVEALARRWTVHRSQVSVRPAQHAPPKTSTRPARPAHAPRSASAVSGGRPHVGGSSRRVTTSTPRNSGSSRTRRTSGSKFPQTATARFMRAPPRSTSTDTFPIDERRPRWRRAPLPGPGRGSLHGRRRG